MKLFYSLGRSEPCLRLIKALFFRSSAILCTVLLAKPLLIEIWFKLNPESMSSQNKAFLISY
ncbi:hypothetical protein HERIO_1571 [Hepatospora eriocheir]|uniref:Uncharacterized protein n=1 Tax=Hepatospora eriocheir TaxID=1081669 RepID=A0A1X0Q9R6_9MICR|nr:hypothetical protein HERIO_1571 [Hepatospora eriocheir]